MQDFLKKNKTNILTVVITALVVSGLFVCWNSLTKKEKTQNEIVPNTASGGISGHIFITLGSGESLTAKGVDVYLIPKTMPFDQRNEGLEKAKNGVVSLTNDTITDLNSFLNSDSGSDEDTAMKNFNFLLDAMRYTRECINKSFIFYSESSTYHTSSTIEGEYQFKGLDPFNYYLYVKYKTNVNEGYWIEPITIKAGDALTLDLNNSNFTDEDSYFRRSTIVSLRDSLTDTIEALLRSTGGDDLTVAKAKLQLMQDWEDPEAPPTDAGKFQYPEPVKSQL